MRRKTLLAVLGWIAVASGLDAQQLRFNTSNPPPPAPTPFPDAARPAALAAPLGANGADPGVLPPTLPTGPDISPPPPLVGSAAPPAFTTQYPTDPFTGEQYKGYPVTYPVAAGAVGRPVYDPMQPSAVVPAAFPGSEHRTGPGASYIDPCEPRTSPLFESLSIFFGIDGSKEPYDLGVNANFGYRTHINWGIPLVEEFGLGLHVAAGFNRSNNAVRVLRNIESSSDRNLAFATLGVFRRNKGGYNWEFAWDYRTEDYYEGFDLSQWRGAVSWSLNELTEVGVWGTWRDKSNVGHIAGQAFTVRAVNQINLFLRRTWENDIVTSAWVGLAEEHGRFTLGGPLEPHVQTPVTFGADMFVPLSASLALWGEAHFITPNDSGAVTATLGIAWFPGRTTHRQATSRTAPLLSPANHTNFQLDLQR